MPYYLYRQKQMVAQLENVGYTLNGHESLYNIQMMEERQHILGLGVGAASKYIHPQDWTLETVNNPKDLLLYNERIDEIIEKKRARLTALARKMCIRDRHRCFPFSRTILYANDCFNKSEWSVQRFWTQY